MIIRPVIIIDGANLPTPAMLRTGHSDIANNMESESGVTMRRVIRRDKRDIYVTWELKPYNQKNVIVFTTNPITFTVEWDEHNSSNFASGVFYREDSYYIDSVSLRGNKLFNIDMIFHEI